MDTQAKQRLEDERRRLLDLKHTQAEEGGFGLDAQQDASGELSSYGDHPGDQGTETAERERAISMRDSIEMQLREVEDALERVDRGDYGHCEVCGKPIDDERLAARPTARLCIEHQRRVEDL